jgi:hypothetical protein
VAIIAPKWQEVFNYFLMIDVNITKKGLKINSYVMNSFFGNGMESTM